MKASILVLALLSPSLTPAQAGAPAVSSAVTDRAIVLELTVPASPAAVWRAFTTTEGLSTWLGPSTVVDLRPGGDWLVKFPGSTGGGTIVSFIPRKELVVAALAPDRFPTVRAQRTRAVFHFEPHGDGTLVRLTQTGWQSGPEWDRAYEYLMAGNAQLLGTLHRRFVNGPIDWQKEFGQAPKPATTPAK